MSHCADSSSKKLRHEPVLKQEVLALLFFSEVKTVFDGTLGLGGHAEALLSEFPSIQKYIACDLDSEHLAFAEKRLEKWKNKMVFHRGNFSEIKKVLNSVSFKSPLIIFLDLGLCSHHVDDATRGFSFSSEGPLSMSFDTARGSAAADFLNTASQKDIEKVLRDFGEEPFAHKLSQKMVEAREDHPFVTTQDLVSLIEKHTSPVTRKKTLMRVFQGIRIAVNDELGHLERTLRDALEIMKSGDRMGIISYHSLEDRIVKKTFATVSSPRTEATDFSLHTVVEEPSFRLLTRKPIAPSDLEISNNPRSRSARFRIIEKI